MATATKGGHGQSQLALNTGATQPSLSRQNPRGPSQDFEVLGNHLPVMYRPHASAPERPFVAQTGSRRFRTQAQAGPWYEPCLTAPLATVAEEIDGLRRKLASLQEDLRQMTMKNKRLEEESRQAEQASARDQRIEWTLNQLLRREEDLLESVGCMGDRDRDYQQWSAQTQKWVAETLASIRDQKIPKEVANTLHELSTLPTQVHETNRLIEANDNKMLAQFSKPQQQESLDLGYPGEEVANSYSSYDVSSAKDSTASMNTSPNGGDTESVRSNLVDVIE